MAMILSRIQKYIGINVFYQFPIRRMVKKGLVIGKNVHIGENVLLDKPGCWLISIGDDCVIAPRVMIFTHDASMVRHLGYAKMGKVIIGSKTFIGAGSIILPNIRIGNNVIIGAGSVVTHDIPDNVVAAGNPAVVIQQITQFLGRHQENLQTHSVFTQNDLVTW